jgi:prophage tail gpP-like protein
MALWDLDQPDLASIKIRVYPAILTPPTTVQATVLRQSYAHAQLAPLLGPGLQFGLPGGTTLVTKRVQVTKQIPPQPGYGPGVDFDHFLSYEYAEDFLTPSDSWSFTIDQDELSQSDVNALVPGSRVEVSIDGNPQSVGYLRKVRTKGNKSGGTIITAEGRDWLSPVVDAHIDPNTHFTASMTLEQLMTTVFGPFGVGVQFTTDDTANLNSITGRVYGTPTGKRGTPLKSFVLHALKPYAQEGAFAFASRVAQRFGVWIWPMADGKTVMVGTPNFDAPARYAIHRKTDATRDQNNVLDGEVIASDEEQPSIIFASGWGGGGEFAHSTLRGAIVNPLVQVPPQTLSALLAPYKGLVPIVPSLGAQQSAQQPYGLIANVAARALYLYDSEAHTQAELNAFLRREMALRMRKALSARYTVMGHKINGQPLAVNTTIDVDDDRGNLHKPMWILGRHFSKSAAQGTLTALDLIQPNSLVF